jgi:hypothetical protein
MKEEKIEACKSNQHHFVDIVSNKIEGVNEIRIVKWCSVCGSITMDCDKNGETIPSYFMALREPKTLGWL